MFTLAGSFTYQGTSPFAKGLIGLMVSMMVSGVKLTKLDGFDGGGLFVQRGTVTFEVSGNQSEIDRFRAAYEKS